ncbi:MAG: FRG domain-containing protein [Saprospiraceae bacterium]|nr:FRG domain-containing protein [Saprospiraceae bacterium]
MLIKHPSQLKTIYEDRVVHSLSEIISIIETIQMLKNSSGLEYFEHYRGHSLESYKLEPGLSRLTKDSSILKDIEQELQVRFEKEFLPMKLDKLELSKIYNGSTSYEREWKMSLQSQHLGLKTRLLDWSINWRIALMFAIENEVYHGRDGVFWIFFCPREWRYNSARRNEYLSIHPFEIADFYLINQGFLLDRNFKEYTGSMRQLRQAGRYTLQPYDKAIIPLESQPEVNQYLIKIIIDGGSKAQIKKDLEESEGIILDWAYYKNESEIDEMLKIINTETILKFIL